MTACEEMGMLWKFIRGCQLCHVPKPRRTWLKSSLFAFHSMHRAGIGASTWQWALHQAHWHRGALLCCCLTRGFQPAFPFLIESIAFSLDVFHGDKNPERLLLLPRCPQASFVSQLCCFMKASYLWTWDPRFRRNITPKITWYFDLKTGVHFICLLLCDICSSHEMLLDSYF